MGLQADIDALLRDRHPTPFGSAKWKDARPETLQRLVAMTAIQFILFEQADWLPGNEAVHSASKSLLSLMANQIESLGDKPTRA